MDSKKATFAQHISEIRSRLKWSLIVVTAGSILGYLLHEKLLELLQKPIGQTLYYNTPSGALSFIVKLCIAFGFIISLPFIVHQILAFFGPVLSKRFKLLTVQYMIASVLLATAGIAFAYFISLPAALHFLTSFSAGSGIESWLGVDEYFSFVLAYIVGFAVLFQLPIIISFINKITPLTPIKLVGATRYVILLSFIAAAIITPTPDPLNQAIMAVPVILLYFLSAMLIVVKNGLANRKIRKQVRKAMTTPVEEKKDENLAPPASQPHTGLGNVLPEMPSLMPQPLQFQTAGPARSSFSVDGIIASPLSRPRINLPTPSRQEATYQQRYTARPVEPTRLNLISDFV